MSILDNMNIIQKALSDIKNEQDALQRHYESQLKIISEADIDLRKNYAFINKEFIDLVTIFYPCVVCGDLTEIEDLEKFNPDFHNCCGDAK